MDYTVTTRSWTSFSGSWTSFSPRHRASQGPTIPSSVVLLVDLTLTALPDDGKQAAVGHRASLGFRKPSNPGCQGHPINYELFALQVLGEFINLHRCATTGHSQLCFSYFFNNTRSLFVAKTLYYSIHHNRDLHIYIGVVETGSM